MNTLDTEALVERQGQCVLLANVLTMTQFMLERARKREWELVTELEGQRRELLNECFATAVSPEHSEIFSEALAAMLHLNEELVAATSAKNTRARKVRRCAMMKTLPL